MHLVHPPKFCLTIVPRGNWKQWFCKILGINKEYYGLCETGEYKAFVVPCRHYGMLSIFPGVSFIGRGKVFNKQLVTLKFDTAAMFSFVGGKN